MYSCDIFGAKFISAGRKKKICIKYFRLYISFVQTLYNFFGTNFSIRFWSWVYVIRREGRGVWSALFCEQIVEGRGVCKKCFTTNPSTYGYPTRQKNATLLFLVVWRTWPLEIVVRGVCVPGLPSLRIHYMTPVSWSLQICGWFDQRGEVKNVAKISISKASEMLILATFFLLL